MFRIGEFSKMSKVSIKTLRYYDEVDLLKPGSIDPETGYRSYTTQQLLEIHTIQSYRQMGLTLKEIKLQITNNSHTSLAQRKEELIKEQLILADQISRIDFLLSQKAEEIYMQYHAVVKETPQGIIYAKKMLLKDYTDYFVEIPKLGEEVTSLNPEMQCAASSYNFVVYLDGEYKEENRYIEFCEMVDRFGKSPEGVTFRQLDSTIVVSVMHRGSYADLGLAYAYLAKWIENNDYLISDNPRESFIDGIWNKDSEKDWLTEIQIPVIKTKA